MAEKIIDETSQMYSFFFWSVPPVITEAHSAAETLDVVQLRPGWWSQGSNFTLKVNQGPNIEE